MTLLRATGITVSFGRLKVLDALDFSLDHGEIVGLIGPNGAGKTTLLRVLANLQHIEAGETRLEDLPYARIPRRVFARRISYLPQNPPIHWPLPVERLVALGRLPHQSPWQSMGSHDAAAIANAMAQTETTALAPRSATTLSGGERMRVMLARALAGEPEILLADEPVTSLDPYHQIQVMNVLAARARKGKAVVVVLHDLNLAARYCTRLVLLAHGKPVAAGTPEEVLTETNLAKTYRITAVRGRYGTTPYLVPWNILDEREKIDPAGPASSLS